MTDQQEKFATEYAICGNATQAAKNAGYSEATAYSQGQRLLKNVEVAEKIESLKAQAAEDLRKKMAREASTAFDVLVKIMNNDGAKDADRIKCAVDLLDRAGYVAEKKVEVKSDVNIAESSERISEVFNKIKEDK